MRKKELISVNDAAGALLRLLAKYKAVLISAVVFGLAAHMFMLNNILLNADASEALFGKGATLESGRWALEASRYIFPDFTLPWLYGLLSILFIAAASAVAVRIFNIKSPVFQVLLGAVAVSSPVMTATLCFMFSAPPYCLAILLSVLAVYFVSLGGKGKYFLGALCLAVSLGFYQAYIAISASLFVVLLLQKLMCGGEDWKTVLRLGIKYFVSLLIALAVYGLITLLSLYISGTALISYGYSSTAPLTALRICYTNIISTLFMGTSALVPNTASLAARTLLLLCGGASLLMLMGKRSRGDRLFAVGLLLILPVAINCLYFAVSVEVMHTLVKAGYVSFYVLCVVAVEAVGDKRRLLSWIAALSLLLCAVLNVFYANECYMKMKLQYEYAYALYSSVAEDIRECPDYEEDCTLIILGDADEALVPGLDFFDTSNNVGLNPDMVNIYTRGQFIKNFVGLNLDAPDWGSIYAMDDDSRYLEMPCYPDEGYIKRIDEHIVVKFG